LNGFLSGTSDDSTLLQPDSLEIAKLEERARLIYVGITRAKKGLFLSTHLLSSKYDKKNNKKNLNPQPSMAFRILAQLIAEINPDQLISPL
jgi:superfamily I DNA/RNA helicase